MLDPKRLDEFAKRVTEHMPAGLREFQQEMEQNVRTAMHSAFSRMDLITREEFDAQAKVLARTRAKVDELESKIGELEQQLAGAGAGAGGGGSTRSKSRSGGSKKSGSSE